VSALLFLLSKFASIFAFRNRTFCSYLDPTQVPDRLVGCAKCAHSHSLGNRRRMSRRVPSLTFRLSGSCLVSDKDRTAEESSGL
jgi:hypothetical protein